MRGQVYAVNDGRRSYLRRSSRIAYYTRRMALPDGYAIEQAALLSKEYIEAIIMDDAFRIDGMKRDVCKMRMLLKSIARNESTTASRKKLQNDVMETDSQDIDANTVTAYLDVFERLFLLDNQLPFSDENTFIGNVRNRRRSATLQIHPCACHAECNAANAAESNLETFRVPVRGAV